MRQKSLVNMKGELMVSIKLLERNEYEKVLPNWFSVRGNK